MSRRSKVKEMVVGKYREEVVAVKVVREDGSARTYEPSTHLLWKVENLLMRARNHRVFLFHQQCMGAWVDTSDLQGQTFKEKT